MRGGLFGLHFFWTGSRTILILRQGRPAGQKYTGLEQRTLRVVCARPARGSSCRLRGERSGMPSGKQVCGVSPRRRQRSGQTEAFVCGSLACQTKTVSRSLLLAGAKRSSLITFPAHVIAQITVGVVPWFPLRSAIRNCADAALCTCRDEQMRAPETKQTLRKLFRSFEALSALPHPQPSRTVRVPTHCVGLPTASSGWRTHSADVPSRATDTRVERCCFPNT